MQRFSKIMMTVSAGFFVSWACLGPGNMEGVAFTSDETVDIQKLMGLGVENVNYIREGEAPDISIRYKSHYDDRAIVFIGNYGLSYQQGMRMNCMGVIWPIPDSADPHVLIRKETFDFAAAVKKELEWLVYYGICKISYEKIVTMDSVLSKADYGGMQFWTHAGNVLAYNSWYVYDSVSGKWMTGGVNGVRAVDGVSGVKGCSVLDPGTGAPPSGLGTTAITAKTHAAYAGTGQLAIRQLGNGGLIAFLPQPLAAEAVVSIIDCRGAIVKMKRVPAGVRSLCIGGLAKGHYAARLVK